MIYLFILLQQISVHRHPEERGYMWVLNHCVISWAIIDTLVAEKTQ